jgi:uncharacterized membrane protein required for colicin V production
MFAGIFRSFWGSLVMLIALLIVLERAGGVSRILGATGGFVNTTVKSFR